MYFPRDWGHKVEKYREWDIKTRNSYIFLPVLVNQTCQITSPKVDIESSCYRIDGIVKFLLALQMKHTFRGKVDSP